MIPERCVDLPKLPTTGNVWDGERMVHPPSPPRPDEFNPGWLWVNCGCCAGLEWGGEYPRECRGCGGSAEFAVHAKSGRGALYPGGPFNGWRFDPDDAQQYFVPERCVDQ